MREAQERHEPKDHHYVPAFYLRQWEHPNLRDKLVEFRHLTMSNGSKIVDKEVSAKATGYQTHLYSISTADPEILDHSFERDFMSNVDDRASRVLNRLISGAKGIDEMHRDDWARFVYVQMMRSPEEMQDSSSSYQQMWELPPRELEEWYQGVRVSGMPNTLADINKSTPAHELQKMHQDSLRQTFSEGLVLNLISKLNWHTRTVSKASYSLLTSDRPVFCNNRLSFSDGLLFMPLSPTMVFYALPASSPKHKILREASDNQVVRFCNQIIVGQAHQYVWASDKQHRKFIARRFGTARQKSFNQIAIDAHRELVQRQSLARRKS